MQTTHRYCVVLVTVPDRKTARRLATAALTQHLAACVSIVPSLESHYWWQGKIESGRELLLIFKTERRRLAALEKVVLAAHPYDTPEFVALPLLGGTRRYLAWLGQSLLR